MLCRRLILQKVYSLLEITVISYLVLGIRLFMTADVLPPGIC